MLSFSYLSINIGLALLGFALSLNNFKPFREPFRYALFAMRTN
jgi:hypothetical protein